MNSWETLHLNVNMQRPEYYCYYRLLNIMGAGFLMLEEGIRN